MTKSYRGAAARRLVALLLVATSAPAAAAEFRNSYLAFQLPSGWACEQEGSEFVCEPGHAPGEKVPSTMVLTAKVAGSDDTLAEYRRHLEMRAAQLGRAGLLRAPAYSVIDGTLWVDAMLAGSEIPGHDTRYLATVKDGIGILFTFSAYHSSYPAQEGAAIQAVHTMRVVYVPQPQ